MARTRSIVLTAWICVLAGCDGDVVRVAGPSPVELWLPPVVATAAQIDQVAELAADPVLDGVTEWVAADRRPAARIALNDFEAGLAVDPAASFAELERALGALDAAAAVPDADAELAGETMTLYRDWASQALFDMDRETLEAHLVKNGG